MMTTNSGFWMEGLMGTLHKIFGGIGRLQLSYLRRLVVAACKIESETAKTYDPSMTSRVSLHQLTRSTVLRPGQEAGTDNRPTGIATTEPILADTPDESEDGDGGEDVAHVGDARRGDGAGEHKVNYHLEWNDI